MTDQELKDLVASFAKDRKEAAEEAAARRKEAAEEAAARRKEAAEEAAARRKEAAARSKEIFAMQAETARMIKELSRRMGGVDENIGSHAEQYFQNVLMGKLVFAGQKYNKMIPNLECCKNGVSLIEFDIVLVNGKSIAIIETKHRIHPKFVKQLVEERLPKFRELWPEYSKHKIYLGIAGFSFSQKVLEEARKHGIGIIKQVGDGVEVETNNLKVY